MGTEILAQRLGRSSVKVAVWGFRAWQGSCGIQAGKAGQTNVGARVLGKPHRCHRKGVPIVRVRVWVKVRVWFRVRVSVRVRGWVRLRVRVLVRFQVRAALA